MIVSFDLDETLFVNPEKVPTEKPLKFPLCRIYRDRLRSGTVELLTWINKSDIELWIYTTSYRSERYIRNIFRHYGIKIDNIINGKRHAEEVQGSKKELCLLNTLQSTILIYTLTMKFPYIRTALHTVSGCIC